MWKIKFFLNEMEKERKKNGKRTKKMEKERINMMKKTAKKSNKKMEQNITKKFKSIM